MLSQAITLERSEGIAFPPQDVGEVLLSIVSLVVGLVMMDTSIQLLVSCKLVNELKLNNVYRRVSNVTNQQFTQVLRYSGRSISIATKSAHALSSSACCINSLLILCRWQIFVQSISKYWKFFQYCRPCVRIQKTSAAFVSCRRRHAACYILYFLCTQEK